MEGTPMAGKHVMEVRLGRPPARVSNQQSWSSQAPKASNRPAASRSGNRGGSQQRHREGRPRDLAIIAEPVEDDEDDDEGYLILDAYQDDRKGVLRQFSAAPCSHSRLVATSDP